ncbi:MAG TPA: HAMP domain-containing sensor histidine kinase [Trebonia sp.]|nr:HAMP domain-containing sensor histidine kinase [Trebonia sp.]
MTRRLPHPRLPSLTWPRRPRHTARLRFTLLAGGLFLVSGAAVLGLTYLLFAHSGHHSGVGSGLGSGGGPGPGIAGAGPGEYHSSGGLEAAAKAAQAAQMAADRHDLLIDLAIALAVIAALAVLAGWFFAGRMLRPVRTITATARRISSSNLTQRLALDHADQEFKELGDTLDDLFARLQAAFDAQRHFVANASHELRSPLTRERTLLQVALEDPTLDLWQSTGQQLLASNREQGRLIEALLALASSETGLDHQERIDLAAVCDDVLERPNPDAGRLGIHVETALDSAPLEGDPRLIERLVANLTDNAVGHNVADGHVRITTSVTASGRAVLSVTNTGRVLPPGEIDRLFQPFQRLDPARTHHKNGHGLGLSIVRAIATAHCATITAQPIPAGGLRVEITFPPPVSPDEQSASYEPEHAFSHLRNA